MRGVHIIPEVGHDAVGFGIDHVHEVPIGRLLHQKARGQRPVGRASAHIGCNRRLGGYTVGAGLGRFNQIIRHGRVQLFAQPWRVGELTLGAGRQHVAHQHAVDRLRRVGHRAVHDCDALTGLAEQLPEGGRHDMRGVDQFDGIVARFAPRKVEVAVLARVFARGKGDPGRPTDVGNAGSQLRTRALRLDTGQGGQLLLLDPWVNQPERGRVEADNQNAVW